MKGCRVHGATGRQVATGPTAVRLGNSLSFSESWFHHLYTGLVGINVTLQNRAQPNRSPFPMTSHLPQSKSQSPPGLQVHHSTWILLSRMILSLPQYHPSLLRVLSPQGWALELPRPEMLFQTPVQLTLGLFPADTGLHICSCVSLLSWRMKHCLIRGSIPSGYKCLAWGGGGGGWCMNGHLQRPDLPWSGTRGRRL